MAVIVSKDADFAQLAVHHPVGPQVISIRLGNAATEPLLATLQHHMQEILLALDERERLIEVR
jgi:predicted nuclease of predicted toxin-antitoxin system